MSVLITPLSTEPCARDAQLAAAASLEAACWPERHAGGAAVALPELRRAAALRRAALLLRHDAAAGEGAPTLGFVLVTWAAGEGRVCKARKHALPAACSLVCPLTRPRAAGGCTRRKASRPRRCAAGRGAGGAAARGSSRSVAACRCWRGRGRRTRALPPLWLPRRGRTRTRLLRRWAACTAASDSSRIASASFHV